MEQSQGLDETQPSTLRMLLASLELLTVLKQLNRFRSLVFGSASGAKQHEDRFVGMPASPYPVFFLKRVCMFAFFCNVFLQFVAPKHFFIMFPIPFSPNLENTAN